MYLARAIAFARHHRHGVLATQKRDGRPQLSNITYSVSESGHLIRISITADRAKAKNLARDPRCSLHIAQDDFWAYAVIEGTAELSAVATSPDDEVVEELVDLYRAVAGDHADWQEYRATMVRDGRMVVRITPERAYGMLSD